jgi:hypothetical protein
MSKKIIIIVKKILLSLFCLLLALIIYKLIFYILTFIVLSISGSEDKLDMYAVEGAGAIIGILVSVIIARNIYRRAFSSSKQLKSFQFKKTDKLHIIITLSLLPIFVIYFFNLDGKNKDKFIPYTINNIEDYGLNFNLDISSLDYDMPFYTKVCIPEYRTDCFSGGVCEKKRPSIFLLYDEINNLVYRCDEKPCDFYEVNKEKSGFYTNLMPVMPGSSIVKIDEDSNYVEIVSLGLDFIIYRGLCFDNIK